MKLITVFNANQTLEGLSGQEGLGAHLAYWMTKFVIKTAGDKEFFIKKMNELVKKYGGEIKEDGIQIPAEQTKDFNKDVEILQNTEVEDPEIRFDLSELSQELKLSMKQMYAIMEFINEDK